MSAGWGLTCGFNHQVCSHSFPAPLPAFPQPTVSLQGTVSLTAYVQHTGEIVNGVNSREAVAELLSKVSNPALQGDNQPPSAENIQQSNLSTSTDAGGRSTDKRTGGIANGPQVYHQSTAANP